MSRKSHDVALKALDFYSYVEGIVDEALRRSFLAAPQIQKVLQ